MSVALHGNLRDFGIGEVFQLIGQQQKTGMLAVDGDAGGLRIAFDGGSVVWAESAGAYEGAALGDMLVRVGLIRPERRAVLEAEVADSDRSLGDLVVEAGEVSADVAREITDLVTTDTIFSLLRWRSGSFHFTSQPVFHNRGRADLLPAEQILMDGLRMVDEWRTLDPVATGTDGIFRRTGSFDTYREAHSGEAPERLVAAERLFLLIDGRLQVRRAIDLSRLGEFEGARLLSRLRKLGVIEPLSDEELARFRARTQVRPRSAAFRFDAWRLFAALPYAALALVVWLAARPAPPVEGFLGGDPVAAADAVHEALRLRQSALAFRFARGRWPSRVSDLEELRGATRMAGIEADSYYFRRRDDGVVALAPER
ncbi:MAG: DUF4388 domain-containing protein [Deltaproteobacteria bacterium]|nr:DUF4388 domain-containing protein [Deltaproteobacteria bacterium]MBW2392978.1 DUF4388 domain-containing protein [Deltaproteobacteria bacterium]